ncbi:MAG: T9SS type A sorting domain-containing protein, partial [Bacteroidota bacterium]
YIFSGTTTSNNGDVSGFHGFADTWVVNLDSAGNILWQKCLGGTLDENNLHITPTTEGGFASVSWSASNDGNVTSNYGSDDFWVVKQDSAGTIEWQKNYGGSFQDMGNDIVQTVDGGFLLSGATLSNDSDVTGNHGFVDSWIVKIDSIGNLQWQKCLGGTGQDESLCTIQTSDGGYIVTSRCNSNDGNVTGSHGNTEGWVVKLDSAGTIIWQRCYGGTNHDFFFYAAETSSKNILFLGATYSNDGDVSGNHDTTATYADLWVVKTDSIGNIIWQKCMGGTNDESGYGIEETTDGGCIILGYTVSNNGDVNGNHGGHDFWVVKLAPDTVTGIPNSKLPITNYQFSPNPLTTQSKLTFKNSNKEKFLFILYDITGRLTETISTTNNEIILTKGNKQPGVYLFNLDNEKTGERWNGKIIVSN